MFILNDKIYKNANGDYYTKEFIERNGDFDGKVWKCGHQECEMALVEKVASEVGSGKVIRCNYTQLFKVSDNMVLCNNISNNIELLELVNGSDHDEEEDYYREIYQLYIIDSGLARYLIRHTDEIIYYYKELGIYILGVTHWGTGWEYVDTDFKL